MKADTTKLQLDLLKANTIAVLKELEAFKEKSKHNQIDSYEHIENAISILKVILTGEDD